jgi:hypothetical protein
MYEIKGPLALAASKIKVHVSLPSLASFAMLARLFPPKMGKGTHAAPMKMPPDVAFSSCVGSKDIPEGGTSTRFDMRT